MVARNAKSSISTVFEGREATTGNASAVRRLSTASVHQADLKDRFPDKESSKPTILQIPWGRFLLAPHAIRYVPNIRVFPTTV